MPKIALFYLFSDPDIIFRSWAVFGDSDINFLLPLYKA
jgi:hypothetical protein